jgi:hypothetical protein
MVPEMTPEEKEELMASMSPQDKKKLIPKPILNNLNKLAASIATAVWLNWRAYMLLLLETRGLLGY